jgi:signal transduction histidine kinase
MGRIVLGPYLPAEVKAVPRELSMLDPELDPRQLKRLLASLPRAKEETIREISLHLTRTLDLILYGGHRALLTSSLHLMTVRESFLELEDRNRRLESALLRLQELDRLKSDFLATISHELRTPLTSVIGYSEMLEQGLFGNLSPQQRETVAVIHAKGSQLLELIVGLVDLSKMERGSLQLSPTTVDIGALLSDVVATLKPIALEAEVGLECRVAEGIGTVMGDLVRLRQVFLNLVDNAVKFTPVGGRVAISAQHGWLEREPEPDAVVVLTARQPAVVVTVQDTGIGIADEEKPRVFDPFYQVDSGTTRKKGGTGLGLSIVRRLVDAHHGAVRIETPPDGGTAFVVTLPRQRASFS